MRKSSKRRDAMSKEISSEIYEVALDKDREEFFESLQEIHLSIEKIAGNHGIPLEVFDNLWEEFTTKLDDSLIEKFSLDRDTEDE